MTAITLHGLLEAAAARHPERVALEDLPDGSITYRELSALSDEVRDCLLGFGVVPGDRVGIYLRKSIDAVAAIFGILKAGAAYVPVDPTAPLERNAYVLGDCTVRVAVVESRFEEKLRVEMSAKGEVPALLVLDGAGGGHALSRAVKEVEGRRPAPRSGIVASGPDDLAYILYTSGSTGRPKGVILSHRNAVSFVDWCSETFEPEPTDRFSSHAPLHFDLSILDLYVAIKHGAAVFLIGEDVGKDAPQLASLIAERRLSVW